MSCRLRAIAAAGAWLDPVTPHAALELQLAARHLRKASFWAELARVCDDGVAADLHDG